MTNSKIIFVLLVLFSQRLEAGLVSGSCVGGLGRVGGVWPDGPVLKVKSYLLPRMVTFDRRSKAIIREFPKAFDAALTYLAESSRFADYFEGNQFTTADVEPLSIKVTKPRALGKKS
jgi:hypothetical protein